MGHQINLKINGESYHLEVKANTLLLDLIRDELNLTGTKEVVIMENVEPVQCL